MVHNLMVHKIKFTLRMLICIEGWEFVSVDLIAIIYFDVNFVHFGEFIRDKRLFKSNWPYHVSMFSQSLVVGNQLETRI